MTSNNKGDTHGAHSHSENHRSEIEASSICGCFHCTELYPPTSIKEWVDEDQSGVGTTAMCPKCGIDSVVGDASGYEISKEFMSEMYRHWF